MNTTIKINKINISDLTSSFLGVFRLGGNSLSNFKKHADYKLLKKINYMLDNNEMYLNLKDRVIVTNNTITIPLHYNFINLSEDNLEKFNNLIAKLNGKCQVKWYDIMDTNSNNKFETYKNNIVSNFYTVNNNKRKTLKRNNDIFERVSETYLKDIKHSLENNKMIFSSKIISLTLKYNNQKDIKNKLKDLNNTIQTLKKNNSLITISELSNLDLESFFNSLNYNEVAFKPFYWSSADKYHKFITFKGFASLSAINSLSQQIRCLGEDIRTMTIINKKSTEESRTLMSKSVFNDNMKKQDSNRLEQQIVLDKNSNKTIDVLEGVIDQTTYLVDLTFIVKITCDTLEQLNDNTKFFIDFTSTIGYKFKTLAHSQEDLYNLFHSFKSEKINDRYKVKNINIESSYLTIPTTNTLNYEGIGHYMGYDEINNSHTFIDLNGLLNSNIFIDGQSGMGKTYLTKLLVSQSLLEGKRCVLVDPKLDPDYSSFTNKLGGIVYNSKDIRLDIFKSIRGFDLKEKTVELESIIFLLNQITDISSNTIHQTIEAIYTEAKEKEKIDWKFTLIEKELNKIDPSQKGKLTQYTSQIGVFTNKFDCNSDDIDMTNTLITFNLSGNSDNLTAMLMTIITWYMEKIVFNDKTIGTNIYIDEAHMMSNNAIIGTLSAMARSANGAVIAISQKSDFLDTMCDSKGVTVGKTNFATNISFGCDKGKADRYAYPYLSDDEFVDYMNYNKGDFLLRTNNNSKIKLRLPLLDCLV